jgi:hypothetical protein
VSSKSDFAQGGMDAPTLNERAALERRRNCVLVMGHCDAPTLNAALN